MGLNDNIKVQHAALVPYGADLAVLQAENKVFIKYQMILATDALGRIGIKVGDWDLETMTEDAATPFNDLPWLSKPEDAGSGASNLFRVRTSNANTQNPNYKVLNGNTVITDRRFVGITDFFLVCTANNVNLRDEDIELDSVNGKITILGMDGMQDNDQIIVNVPAIVNSADSVGALLPRLAKIERALAPEFSGQCVKLFKGTKAQVDAMPGYHILDESAGRTLMGYNKDDIRFNAIWDITGNKGHYSVTLTEDNIPEHNHMTVVDDQIQTNDHPSAIGRSLSAIRSWIRFWFKSDAIGKESYELMGAVADINDPTNPQVPSIGPTSYYGKKGGALKAVDVVQPYICLWILGYDPEN